MHRFETKKHYWLSDKKGTQPIKTWPFVSKGFLPKQEVENARTRKKWQSQFTRKIAMKVETLVTGDERK